MKKIISCLLLVVMLLGIFAMTGCRDNTKDGDDRHIVVTYFYGGKLPKDLDLVESAINAYLGEKGSDITIEFYPMSVYSQNYTTALLTDPIDLMCVAFGSSPAFYAEMEMISPVSDEDIKTYCPDIYEMNKDCDMMVRDAEGRILGVATREMGSYNGGCYLIRQSDLEAIGLADQYKDNDRIDYEDLKIIFAKLKEKFPNSYPIGAQLDESSYCVNSDQLGSSKRASGVLDFSDNGLSSTTIVNYYETEGYKNYCKFMLECKNNGWLDPEAHIAASTKNNLFKQGVYRGIWLNGVPSLRDTFSSEADEPCVRLQMVDATSSALNDQSITWALSGTSEKKEAVLEFLNMFWSDKKLMNMVQWGIEGTHFNVVDEENGIIEFANGLNEETSGFYMGGGFYGDKRYIYTYQTSTMTLEEQIAARAEERAAMNDAATRVSPAGAFVFDSSEYNITIKNIESIIDRYTNVLALGGYSEAEYNKFISELKAAGIDNVIAAKQAQLDAYLAGAK